MGGREGASKGERERDRERRVRVREQFLDPKTPANARTESKRGGSIRAKYK